MTNEQRENFERAFSSHMAGCVRICECGKKYYDYFQSYDWEEGELEKLKADPNASGKDYSIGTIILEGTEYCMDCACWHERADKIVNFLDRHGHAIAEFLTLEKKRKQYEANNSPEVK